jgi:integrase
MVGVFIKLRARKAVDLQNPRLLKIKLTTFRHFGGTMIAHYTNGNVLAVKKLLGHKNINSTMKYIGMIHFKDNEFDVATATTLEEAKTILASGYDYVTEKNGIMLFRRPKRFNDIV